jgi:hypothetical protein
MEYPGTLPFEALRREHDISPGTGAFAQLVQDGRDLVVSRTAFTAGAQMLEASPGGGFLLDAALAHQQLDEFVFGEMTAISVQQRFPPT